MITSETGDNFLSNNNDSSGVFNHLINQFSDAVFLIDGNGARILSVNSHVLKLTAFSKNEIDGKPVQEIFRNVLIEDFEPGIELKLFLKRRKRDDLPVSVKVSSPDNKSKIYFLIVTPLQGQHKNLIDNQKVLLENLAQLSRISQAANINLAIKKALIISKQLLNSDLIAIYHAKSGYPELVKIASIEKTEIFPARIPSNDLISLSKTTNWAPGKPVVSEIHKMGRVANLEHIASTPLGEDGALFGLLVVGSKIGQYEDFQLNLIELIGKNISTALQHFILVENQKLKINAQEKTILIKNTLQDETDQGVIIVELNGRIQEINSSAELILGYSEQEVKDQLVEDILIGAEDITSALEDALRGISTHDLGSVYLHRRNGISFPAHVKVLPVLNQEKVVSLLILLRDLSEHEQTRIRTQQLEQRAVLGGFTAIFAHEVRNPINNISTGLQLINTRLPKEDPNQKVIKRMLGDCIRLDHLMESVLSFSRPLEPKIKPMSVSDLINIVIDRWRPRMGRLNIQPVINYPEDVPYVAGDNRLLEQVFTNLISNAVNIMTKSGGTLSIRITPNYEVANHPQVEISISDTGPGIPEELVNRIFEPFVSNNPRGTGLGLAITKHIVTAHRGSINVDSIPGGTVFQVFLPVYVEG